MNHMISVDLNFMNIHLKYLYIKPADGAEAAYTNEDDRDGSSQMDNTKDTSGHY